MVSVTSGSAACIRSRTWRHISCCKGASECSRRCGSRSGMHSWKYNTTNQGTYAWVTEEDASRRHPCEDAWRAMVDEHVDTLRCSTLTHRDSIARANYTAD